MLSYRLVLGAALLAVPLTACGAGKTMTCPTVQSGGAGDIRETPQQIAATGALLTDDSENTIATTAAAVRARHPKASNDAIANYLVVAHCPTIADKPGLSRSEQDAALASFAKRVRDVIGAN